MNNAINIHNIRNCFKLVFLMITAICVVANASSSNYVKEIDVKAQKKMPVIRPKSEDLNRLIKLAKTDHLKLLEWSMSDRKSVV